MAINVSVPYNGGLLPDIILLTQCHYHKGTHEEVFYLQPILSLLLIHTLIPPKRVDMFPPDRDMLRKSERIQHVKTFRWDQRRQASVVVRK